MKYEGLWEKNKREGEGTLHYNLDYDCDKRVGKWRDNEPSSHTYKVGRQSRQAVQILLALPILSTAAWVIYKIYRKRS
jgi:hypothetical protein